MIKYKSAHKDFDKIKPDIILVPIHSDGSLPAISKMINNLTDNYLGKHLKSWSLNHSQIQILPLCEVANARFKLLPVNYGARKKHIHAYEFIDSLHQVFKTLKLLKVNQVLSCLHEAENINKDIAWKIKQSILVSTHAYYAYTSTKSSNVKQKHYPTIFLSSANQKTQVMNKLIQESSVMAQACTYTKDLANLPSNICTPSYLASQAEKLARTYKAIQTKVFSEPKIKKLKMNTFIAVAKGSDEPPKFIIINYRGRSQKNPYVLVGKGITFDTGGISIKPKQGMDELKYDMCGAASILATIEACAKLKLPIHVIGLIPTCENLINGRATKPGDVVKSYDGKTVEILDTDAEGRLILCDALSFAKQFNPKWIVNVATLTGNIILALGYHLAGLFTEDELLAKNIMQSAENCHDRVWRMPTLPEYKESLKSKFADIANIGLREGASIQAAAFLRAFTDNIRFAHLDVAAVAATSGKDKGATGRPTPLLIQLLIDETKR